MLYTAYPRFIAPDGASSPGVKAIAIGLLAETWDAECLAITDGLPSIHPAGGRSTERPYVRRLSRGGGDLGR